MTDRLILENAFGVPGGHAQGRGEGGQRPPSCGPLHGEETPPRSWAQGGGEAPPLKGRGRSPKGRGKVSLSKFASENHTAWAKGGYKNHPLRGGAKSFSQNFPSKIAVFPSKIASKNSHNDIFYIQLTFSML